MKEHIRLKLHKSFSTVGVPHWQDFLSDAVTAPSSVHPQVDAVLAKYNIPVWVTKEYQLSGNDWERAELESGLNRVYRLIIQKNIPIPKEAVPRKAIADVFPNIASIDGDFWLSVC